MFYVIGSDHVTREEQELPTDLTIRGMEIHDAEMTEFPKYPRVEWLTLKRCSVTLPLLPALENIHIDESSVQLANLSRLKTLVARNSTCQIADVNAFQNLRLLEIVGCNLAKLPRLALPNMIRLNLYGNQLKELDLVCSVLRDISVGSNQLKRLSLDCPKLEHLIISNNPICRLSSIQCRRVAFRKTILRNFNFNAVVIETDLTLAAAFYRFFRKEVVALSFELAAINSVSLAHTGEWDPNELAHLI